jgi:hypothetical protein
MGVYSPWGLIPKITLVRERLTAGRFLLYAPIRLDYRVDFFPSTL